MSSTSKPSIVFCHGIWADGSCFSKLIPPLVAEGYEVISAQYNLDSAQSDIDVVSRTLDRVSSPSILVGHSYGGAVITGAGIDDRVVGLVYIAAVAPDEDETAANQQAKFPTTDVFGQIEVADGRDLDAPLRHRVLLRRPVRRGAAGRVGDRDVARRRTCSTRSPQDTAWNTKPSAYIVATDDHAVHPDLDRRLGQADGRRDLRGRQRPLPMMSHPDVVLTAIRNLAATLQETLATA